MIFKSWDIWERVRHVLTYGSEIVVESIGYVFSVAYATVINYESIWDSVFALLSIHSLV